MSKIQQHASDIITRENFCTLAVDYERAYNLIEHMTEWFEKGRVQQRLSHGYMANECVDFMRTAHDPYEDADEIDDFEYE